MKTAINSLATLLLLFSLTIPQTTTAQSELEYFDAIDLRGNLEVNLIRGQQNSIDIEKYDRDKVSVEVVSGVLEVKRKKPFKIKEYEDDPVRLSITYSKLNEIRARAGANLRSEDPVSSNHLHIDLNSGAQARLTVEAGDLEASASEGAQLMLRGKTKSLQAKVSTGAKIEAYDLKTEYAYVKANTGGEAEVSASEAVEASANTGGQVEYKGNPKKVRIDDKLGGEVSGGE